MTRKDFELITSVLARANPERFAFSPSDDAKTAWHLCVNVFAEELARNNPRFNSGKFVVACKAAVPAD
jgi:hypothetical protein